jgi:hypothetical protein
MKREEALERFSIEFRRPDYSEQIQFGRRHCHTAAHASARLAQSGAAFLELCTGVRAVLAMAAALMYWGCAGVNNPLLSSGPHPRVEDCAIVQQATPTRYVCNGKIYTSVQLDEISKVKQVQLSQQAVQGAFPGNSITPTGNFGTYQPSGTPVPASGGH